MHCFRLGMSTLQTESGLACQGIQGIYCPDKMLRTNKSIENGKLAPFNRCDTCFEKASLAFEKLFELLEMRKTPLVNVHTKSSQGGGRKLTFGDKSSKGMKYYPVWVSKIRTPSIPAPIWMSGNFR